MIQRTPVGLTVQYQAPLQKILILHDTTHQNKNLQADVLCLVIAVATQAIVQRTFAALQMGKPVGVVAKSAILLPYVEAVQSQPTIHHHLKNRFSRSVNKSVLLPIQMMMNAFSVYSIPPTYLYH